MRYPFHSFGGAIGSLFKLDWFSRDAMTKLIHNNIDVMTAYVCLDVVKLTLPSSKMCTYFVLLKEKKGDLLFNKNNHPLIKQIHYFQNIDDQINKSVGGNGILRNVKVIYASHHQYNYALYIYHRHWSAMLYIQCN